MEGATPGTLGVVEGGARGHVNNGNSLTLPLLLLLDCWRDQELPDGTPR